MAAALAPWFTKLLTCASAVGVKILGLAIAELTLGQKPTRKLDRRRHAS
jgi:hypothetical protein